MKFKLMRTLFTLVDTENDWKNLLPLTYFREISNILTGLVKIRDKWEKFLKTRVVTKGVFYLEKGPEDLLDGWVIRSSVLPDKDLVRLVLDLEENHCIYHDKDWVACRLGGPVKKHEFFSRLANGSLKKVFTENDVRILKRPWDLIKWNAQEVLNDFDLFEIKNQVTEKIEIVGRFPVFIHPDARLMKAVIDVSEGPVYIGKNVTVLPFVYIKGPSVILENSFLKAGTSIYNGTTLGPWTKVGGEIKNVLFFGFSNKGHDGFLGDSVIAHWCNLGAGTSNSNLKNNYSTIKMWAVSQRKFEDTGEMFLGMVMGDYSRTAINTSVNTGSVIGVSSNIFTRDFPPKFVNSFNWGGDRLQFNYDLKKAMQTASIVRKRREKKWDKNLEKMFAEVKRAAEKYEG